ncbi:MAG: lipase family protein [Clostridia bacterium]|nr:lipase family protein [Clostridia bacterium]
MDRNEPAPGVSAGTSAVTVVPDEQDPLSVRGLSDEQIKAGTPFTIPADSSVFDGAFSASMLELCSVQTAAETADVFADAGFSVVLTHNLDKDDQDPAQSCAYTIDRSARPVNGTMRNVILVSIRGTSGGEWYANFDFAPSHDADCVFAEDSLLAAEDVLGGLLTVAEQVPDPVFLVCGFSRGAACSNLTGVLLNGLYNSKDIYVYTYATPATIKGDAAELSFDNIFNIINPCDLVPRVPFGHWGFRRAGTDIYLDGDEESEQKLDERIASLFDLAPDIHSYYETRHSLSGPGTSDDGITVFESMLLLADALTGYGMETKEEDVSFEESDFSDMIADDSDFSPLVDILKAVSENDGDAAKKIVSQHMPGTYSEKLFTYLSVSENKES